METNVTTTSPTFPRPDYSLPIQERDTYLLIGTFVSVLILMGILMAFMHKNCRNSLLRWRTWLIQLRHSNAMSTRRPRSDIDMTLDLSNPECPVYSKEIHVSSSVKTFNQNQRTGSASSKRQEFAAARKEDGEDSGISIISSSRDGKTVSLPSQQSLNMNHSFERGIHTRDVPLRSSYLSSVSCQSSNFSQTSEFKDQNRGHVNNSFSLEDEQMPFDLHKHGFYLPDSSYDSPSVKKPSWNYELIVPSKIEFTGMASSRSRSVNDLSIEKEQKNESNVTSFSHETVYGEINETLRVPSDKYRNRNRSRQNKELDYLSHNNKHLSHFSNSNCPNENSKSSHPTAQIIHRSKIKREKDTERCPSEHSEIYVSDHRYRKKKRITHNRDKTENSNTKMGESVIPSFQNFEQMLIQRRRRLSRDSAIDQSDYSVYKTKPKVFSNSDSPSLVSSRVYKSEPNFQNLIHLATNKSSYENNRPVSQMSSLSLDEIQSRKRKGRKLPQTPT